MGEAGWLGSFIQPHDVVNDANKILPFYSYGQQATGNTQPSSSPTDTMDN